MLESIEHIEEMILRFIYNLQSPMLDKIMVFLTNLGEHGLLWIAIGLLLLVSKKHRKAGFLLLLSLLFVQLINEMLLKNLIERDRPFYNMTDIKLLIKEPDSYSFPSGHTSSSFAAAFVLFKFYRKYAVFIFSTASLMAFTRLYLTVHYPTDIMSGIIIGYVCSLIAFFVFKNGSLLIKSNYETQDENAA